MHRRAEEPLTQELEEGTSSHGETGTEEEEDKVSKEPSGRVEPAPETVRDYTTLPELYGAPRIGDQIAFKVVAFQVANIQAMKCVVYTCLPQTLELSLPNYTPEVSEYKVSWLVNRCVWSCV